MAYDDDFLLIQLLYSTFACSYWNCVAQIFLNTDIDNDVEHIFFFNRRCYLYDGVADVFDIIFYIVKVVDLPKTRARQR